MALTEDPKVQALVEKTVAKTAKTVSKKILSTIKEAVDTAVLEANEAGDKQKAKALAQLGKNIKTAISEAQPFTE